MSAKQNKHGLLASLHEAGLSALYRVSFSLAAISILLSVGFQLLHEMPLPYYFGGIGLVFLLLPFIAWKEFSKTSKFFLLINVNALILLLSVVFSKAIFVEAFYIPAIGLAILFFNHKHIGLQLAGIFMSAVAFLIHDYISLAEITITAQQAQFIKWAIVLVVFVASWLIFRTFMISKEEAQDDRKVLRERDRLKSKKLKEEKALNSKLADKNSALADKNSTLEEEKAELKAQASELSSKTEKFEENVHQLEEEKQQAEEGGREKYKFFSNMSQEVRMPLNAIIGMTNRLSKDDPREDQLEQLKVLDFSSKTLLALMNDLLVFSKIESGRIEFEETPFNLSELLDSVVESFQFTVDNKDIDLSLDVDDELPDVLVGDSSRLSQVLTNLLINAVRFTNDGRVGIEVKQSDESDDEVRLQFNVIYTGNGITEDEHQEIFDSFNSEQEDGTQSFGGLMTTKRMIVLQDGESSLRNTDEGYVFDVKMPFGLAQNEGGASDMQSADVNSLDEATILVAEDNAINQNVIQRFLEKWGVDVIVAGDGQRALTAFQHNDVNLILMDLQMPNMDGYDAAKGIRALNKKGKSGVPIIALTAAKFEDVKEEVFGSGMNDFLSKSFDPNELKEKLEQHI